MTKKHFEALAHMVATLPNSFTPDQRLMTDLADIDGRFNPNFDRVRFMIACAPLRYPQD